MGDGAPEVNRWVLQSQVRTLNCKGSHIGVLIKRSEYICF